MNELTPMQAKAVETLDRDLVVTAGPGAGKTRVLAERVMRILDTNSAGLGEIVAITFTRKAAAEMKLRIRREIETRVAFASSSREKHRWAETKQQLASAQISTIHGLCSRILRSHPVEATLDPFYAVLDEFEAARLLRDGAGAFVMELIDAGDLIASRYVAAKGRSWLAETMVSLSERLRGAGVSPREALARTLSHLRTEAEFQSFAGSLSASIEELAESAQLTAKQQESREAALGPARELMSEILPGVSLESMRQLEERAKRVKSLMPTAASKAKELIQRIKNGLEELPSIASDVMAQETAEWLAASLEEFGRRVGEEKSARNALDFSDLELMTRDLLRSNEAVRRRVQRSFRYVLVDEFQDTNSLQKEILDLLCPPGGPANLFIVGDGKQSIYRFRGAEVGVFEKIRAEIQSRGGEHVPLSRNFRSHSELVRFFNHLFSQRMTFADEERLAKLGDAAPECGAASLGFVPHEAGEADRGFTPESPAVEVLLGALQQGESSTDRRDVEAAALALRLRQMLGGGETLVFERAGGRELPRAVRGGDIAILLRALSDLKIYERALRQAEIPYVVVAGRGFYHRQEIIDLISLLEFLHNTTDDLALAAVLRSPFFAIDDDALLKLRLGNNTQPAKRERNETLYQSLRRAGKIRSLAGGELQAVLEARSVLSELVAMRSRATAAELLEHAMERTDFLAVGATLFDHRQRTSNIGKFTGQAAAFAYSRGEGLDGFLQHLRAAIEAEAREGEAEVEPEDEHSVRVMTVHKAKGLEFPVVVLPDLARPPAPKNSEMRFDRDWGFGMEVPDLSGSLHPTKLAETISSLDALREEFESARLFYVAATRAKDHLLLSFAANTDAGGQVKTTRGSWASGLLDAFDLAGEADGSRVIEREGIRIRFERYTETEAIARTRGARSMAQDFPEILSGQAFAPSRLPKLDANEQRALSEIEENLQRREWPAVFSHGPISVTRFMEFTNCPRQAYYRKWIGVIDRPVSGGELSWDEKAASFSLPAAERGTLVHRFCELYTEGGDAETLFLRICNERDIPAAERESILRDVRPLLERYAASDVFKEIGSAARVESEYPFWLRTSHCLVRGVIDKIIIQKDGGAKIVDFKTNRISASEAAMIPPPYATQLALYTIAARDALALRPTSAVLYFLEPGVVTGKTFSDSDLDEARADIDRISEAIVQGREIGNFPAHPAKAKCGRCDFKAICPESEADAERSLAD